MTPVTRCCKPNPVAIEAPGLLTLHADDDVAVALRPLAAGERLEVEIAEAIPRGHKVALRALPAGAEVRKFGWPIGRLTAPVAPGAQVHSHNLVTSLSGVEGYRHDAGAVADAAERQEYALHGLSAAGRPRRHAQRDLDPADRGLRRAHRRTDRDDRPRPPRRRRRRRLRLRPSARLLAARRGSQGDAPAAGGAWPAIPMPAAC